MPADLPPTHIASVCVLGPKARSTQSNPRKLDLLEQVVADLIQADLPALDAVLFPGGFLRAGSFIGPLAHRDRVKALAAQPFAARLQAASRRLGRRYPGALLVLGVDSASPDHDDWGDQLCLAYRAGRLVGLARKIFPAPPDTDGRFKTYVPATADYGSRHRFVRLASGRMALLAACYDLFGLTEDHACLPRSRHIKVLWHEGRYLHRSSAFRAVRATAVQAWRENLAAHAPSVALCAIHGFERPGRDNYWQRHGIGPASAVMGGGLAVGTAHYVAKLPSGEQSPLAAVATSPDYLREGARRRKDQRRPDANIYQSMARKGAVVRLLSH